jgi:hypothetical protein
MAKAGECLVAAHLLRHRFNPSAPLVDIGVDLIAYRVLYPKMDIDHVDQIQYNFQVKTTVRNEYKVPMPTNKFKEFWTKAINLMIVFWPESLEPAVLVLPPRLINMLTSGGFRDPNAPLTTTTDSVSLRFMRKEGLYYVRNLYNEITPMINRFDLVESIDIDTTMLPEYACWSDDEKTLVIIDQE